MEKENKLTIPSLDIHIVLPDGKELGKDFPGTESPHISSSHEKLSVPVHPTEVKEALEKVVPSESAKAEGGGLHTAQLGKISDFKIHIKHVDGSPINATYELSAEIAAPKSSFVDIKALSEVGVYKATYKPSALGIHKIHIKVDGKEIRESPFTVDVTS